MFSRAMHIRIAVHVFLLLSNSVSLNYTRTACTLYVVYSVAWRIPHMHESMDPTRIYFVCSLSRYPTYSVWLIAFSWSLCTSFVNENRWRIKRVELLQPELFLMISFSQCSHVMFLLAFRFYLSSGQKLIMSII